MSTPDSNRIVIAVTGANSGLGFGYCQRILRQLSSDASLPPPDARHLPQTSTSTSSLVPSNDSSLARYISSPNTKPPTLTLILACRSRQKAELAIKKLRREHELGLMGRRMRGGKDREGWEQGLEIVFEELDVDRVGGRGGVLDFSRRIKENYPHLTTLVLNAGMGAFKGIHWPGAARQFFTDLVGCVSEPDFIIQEKGWKSADGDRGAVWGVNVLSGYILAKELHSHLLKSPKSLALSPRVLYVSSAKAKPQYLPHPPSADPQLLEEIESYDASKFMGDVVSSRLDWQFSQPETNAVEAGKGRAVRFLRLDPGVVHTGIFVAYLPFILEWCMVAAFYMARWIGSRVHVIKSETAALGLTWLTLAPESAIEPARPPVARTVQEPEPTIAPAKYMSRAWRTGSPFVELGRVAEWGKFSDGPEGGDGFLAECDKVYCEWKAKEKREGMDDSSS